MPCNSALYFHEGTWYSWAVIPKEGCVSLTGALHSAFDSEACKQGYKVA